MHRIILVNLILIVVTISLSNGSRILIANPYGTKSHQNMYIPLTKELARRGHQVTIITNLIDNELAKLENVSQIVMDKLVIEDSMFPNPFAKLAALPKRLETTYNLFKVFVAFPSKVARLTYQDDRIQQLIQTDRFDLVMFQEVCSYACYPFGWLFQAPTIVLSPNVMFSGRAESLGADEYLSYVPFMFSSYSDRMTLMERTFNYLRTKAFRLSLYYLQLYTVGPVVDQFFQDAPSLPEMEANFSLVFTNSHPTFSYPRSLPPQVIEMGGIHCRPALPLPDELDKFVALSGDDGFILFGIGSALRMEDMPQDVIKSFMDAFAKLPQRVIWQWKGQVRSDLPANVLAIPWLPQQDLLGHPKCRAFLTHGGLNGIQEAIYHRVPVLGFPSGSDQAVNIGRAVKEGFALRLEWMQVTEEALSSAIQQLLHDPSFQNAVDRVSSVFFDQSNTPLERAVYWTEYVIRHKGVEHLRLASRHLATYQRALFDVYLVLFVSASIPLVVLYFCLQKCFRRKKLVFVSTPKQIKPSKNKKE